MSIDFLSFDWNQILYYVFQIGLAFVLVLPIAWEREHSTRIMGLRTFPLVAVASCGYVLLATAAMEGNQDAQARTIQGLMTGIGFIGGGAILKEGANVRGTATAASIWTTGVIGATVAFGQYEIAVLVSLVNFLTLRLLTPLEKAIDNDRKPPAEKQEDTDEP
jgi:putative Mg2+ transporter-C (MgtC) family protein